MTTITVQKRTQATIEATPNTTIWHTIKGYLEAKRDAIYEEISHYRAPIPACDVQFNHLLEERSRVFQELIGDWVIFLGDFQGRVASA